jgi:hypothetical protein
LVVKAVEFFQVAVACLAVEGIGMLLGQGGVKLREARIGGG